MTSTTQRETYATWLERKMAAGGFTQRSLARTWKPDDAENARRSLRRYLKGVVPMQRARDEIAFALGSEETGPSDDTEDD